MRYFSVACLMILISHYGCLLGQKGNELGSHFFCVTGNHEISLCALEKESLIKRLSFPYSKKLLYSTDGLNWVVKLNNFTRQILFQEINTGKTFRKGIPLKYDTRPKCILLVGDNLFIGGRSQRYKVLQYNLQRNKWYNLPIPDSEKFKFRKEVDDFAVVDSVLYAIDNAVVGKYAFLYNLNTDSMVKLIGYKGISACSWAHIGASRKTKKYFAVSMSCIDKAGYLEQISLSNIQGNQQHRIDISFRIPEGKLDYYSKYWRRPPVSDFAIIDDYIYIALGSRGLGIVEIKEKYFSKEYRNSAFGELFDIQMFENTEELDSILIEVLSALKLVKFEGESVEHVTAVPFSKYCVLGLTNKKGGFRNVLLKDTTLVYLN